MQTKMPSFSMIHSLHDGFNIVMYSGTHDQRNSLLKIHRKNGLRLTLRKHMLIIFHQGLIHAGGKSRKGKDKLTMEDMRLFAYLWTMNSDGYNTRNDNNSVRSDSTRLHSMVDNFCTGVNNDGNPCHECNIEEHSSLDLSNVDTNKFKNGEIIKGDLNSLGWVVIKSDLIDMSTENHIKQIAYDDKHWYKVGKQPSRQMKFNSFDNPGVKWCINPLKAFLLNLKKLIDPCMPNNNYVSERINLLRNAGHIEYDQRPHSDYPKFNNQK
jgi:hypothetical protein